MDVSRRFFLGGAISVFAASTFTPTLSAGNLPRIWADGKNDDTSGLGALFRKEPVIFAKENIGLDDHGLITFHTGKFRITQTIGIPKDAEFKVEGITFDVRDLDEDLFALCGSHKQMEKFTGLWTKWTTFSPEFPAIREQLVDHVTEDGAISGGLGKIIRPRLPARGVRNRRNFIEVLDLNEPSIVARKLGYDMHTDSVG